MTTRLLPLAAVVLHAAGSSTPLPPHWPLQSKPALEGAVSAQ